MFRRFVMLIAAFFALAASVAQATDADLTRPYPETIYGSTVDGRGLTLRVGSSGCTRKESFHMALRGSPRRATVTAMRVKRDLCKAMFRVVEFTWNWRELELRRGARIRVLNPHAGG